MFRRRHRNGHAARESLARAEQARREQERKAEQARQATERLDRLAQENDVARRLRHALGG